MTDAVQNILSWYESDNPGVKTNLARILYHGRLGGTGKLVILPVDQGYEHGPDRCFVPNPPAYDPHYHFQLAIDAGLSAFASPLGMLEAGASTFAGKLPLILKVNSANLLYPKEGPKTQAVTSSVKDALRLGCSAVGLTIYPGSLKSYDMFETAREFVAAAKEVGLPTVVWSYPRGEDISKEGETAIDVDAYATQIAALLGAHIIKVKLPTGFVEAKDIADLYRKGNVAIDTLPDRVRLVMKAAFNGRRIVVFSGGAKKGDDAIIEEARAIKAGGGNGSIIGRNSFQRDKKSALALLDKIVEVYKS
ncbi:MAG: class I fructose-bisphosphate aldolase [Alphaproteobacteria bacterium]|nr:class I fructose-bisphosphate aldolase [Alphaproteobacteria bacterium]MDE2110995.1 class I fructose-bisphosphate aldolase [Alphaproteobacteria bacterium]MDE2493845.1 class I fructose-bisphosphate aldolase [Alphaproteobacteria bacterium]